MRRLGGGAGRKVGLEIRPSTPAAGARQFRASDWGGARGRGSHPRTRAASGLRPGTLRSPARSWLTIEGTLCAVTKARPDAVRKTPQQSAERRAGLRHWPVISGVPEMGPLARRATGRRGFRTSACRRSAPLFFFGERKTDEGHPEPHPNRAAERWLFDN